jgi:hypothetical protein
MKITLTALCTTLLVAGPAAAQTHAKHTVAHDSAHAIALSDADHVALHQFLLGQWSGTVPMQGSTNHDTLAVRFENDREHQQLLIRNREGVVGFLIRGDSLQWKQAINGSACTVSTSISALVAAAKAPATVQPQMKGTLICGRDQSQLTLKKTG